MADTKEPSDLDELNSIKGFKLLHLNVRSIMKKIDQLKTMFFESKLDVLSISETWLKPCLNSKLVDLKGFEQFRLDRKKGAKTKKRGGGLLLYVNSKHSSNCESLDELDISNENLEAQWILIHRPHCKNVVVCNMCRPPNGDLEKAVKYLDNCIRTINTAKVDVFLLGDLNVNYKNTSSPSYKKLHFFAQSNGLSQLIKSTTRNTDKTKSLIDLALSNSKFISKAGTFELFISYHQPIYVIHKKGKDKHKTEQFQGRSYRNFDRGKFEGKLRQYNWDILTSLTDPEEAWNFIVDKITLVLDEMCPVRTFHIKNYRPDWMTKELIEQIKDRDYFYRKAKRSGDEDAWNIAKFLRNVTNANIRQSRREFVLRELEENENNSKKFWKVIRDVIPSDKSSSKRDISLKVNGLELEKEDVAHFINDYFINVGNAGNAATHGAPNSFNDTQRTAVEVDSSDVWGFSELRGIEVHRVVNNINISKSSGLQNISSFVIKEAFKILNPEVTKMFNMSIKTSKFPTPWKEALVIPIPKSGSLSKVQNYRPISLLPLPGKILEKLVHSQISDYLESALLLNAEQHGFRKDHSTIHSIAQFTAYVNSNLDDRTPTYATFVNFRKAFDCVQHDTLLDKLKNLDLSDQVISWIQSYLSSRKQRVLANGIHSTFLTIKQGVPQGSVLGPLFYIIYANDLTKYVRKCKIALYADDTVIYIADSDSRKAVSKLQSDIDALSSWCQANDIKANTDKTKVMVFGSHKSLETLPPFEVKIDSTPLQVVTSYKYLGITLDSQLNYNSHVNKIISSVASKLKQFQRMRSFLSIKAATLVYKSMLLPILEYGDVFLSAASKANRKKLHTLQNKGLRCALNKGLDTSSALLHTEAGLMKLARRREQHLINFMYDWSRNPDNLKKKSKKLMATRSGAKKTMKIKKPNTEKFKHSLAYRGPKKWNSLSADMHQLVSKPEFKAASAKLVHRKSVTQ